MPLSPWNIADPNTQRTLVLKLCADGGNGGGIGSLGVQGHQVGFCTQAKASSRFGPRLHELNGPHEVEVAIPRGSYVSPDWNVGFLCLDLLIRLGKVLSHNSTKGTL